jgi:CelD/BcsL family acetyltransferase involved in cellulose biosynthesis
VISQLQTTASTSTASDRAVPTQPALAVSLSTTFDRVTLQRDWCQLQEQTNSSFFTSWPWVSAWLENLPPEIAPGLISAREHGRLVGLGIVVVRNLMRHRVMPVKSMHLHSTGAKSIDVVAIEYNDFLIDRRYDNAARNAMVDYLLGQKEAWEEISFPGVAQADAIQARLNPRFMCTRLIRPTYEVNLGMVRQRDGDYLGMLGTDTRYQIKRSLKRFEALGSIQTEVAQDVPTAFLFLAGLKQLHASYWQSRGKEGAFYSGFSNAFHHRLIEQALAQGSIQLIKFTAGAQVIGYLYNFVHAGRVYAYQSGIDYALMKGTQPGLVMHALAIQENARLGHATYDFMAGEYRYKRSMCTGTNALTWLTVQRDLPKLRIEALLRRIKWRLIALRHPRTSR